MAAPPVVAKSKGPLIDPALCRCCRSIKKCRLLSFEYEWMGQKEIYCDMFIDCFGLLISHLDGENKDKGICATCVLRLRDACAFRKQVLQSEDTFLTSKIHPKEEDTEMKWDIQVKLEPTCEDEIAREFAELNSPRDEHSDTGIQETEKPPKTRKSPRKSVKKAVKKKPKKNLKKQLLTNMKKMRDKLDTMVDQPAAVKPAKKQKIMDRDEMVYSNTVTILQNSYICPFVNRVSMYYCYYCKDQFTNPSELREHTWGHDPKTFESMIEYNKMPKTDITRIDCRLCPEKISNITDFKNHIKAIHNKKIYPIENEFLKFKLTMSNLKCTECDESFPYIDMLVKHMIEHFGKFVCDLCGACFIEITSLRSHIKNHSKVETNFPCEICGKNLKSKYSRFLHIATIHEKKATINCYKCDATFMSYALRTKHLIEFHGDKRTFPCKFCDKVYNRRKTLGEHHRRNHLKVFRHKCDLCDQKFYLPSRLKEHMATHTGERNFRCEFCDKSYPRLQSLQEHIRSHSNERRFKCNICGSGFTQNGSLKSHMKNHHQFDLDNY